MIPPIPVTAATFRYTRDALVVRVADLERALEPLTIALSALGSDTRVMFDTDRILIRAELSTTTHDIADLRDRLGGVLATIDPSEAARATAATGAPLPWLRPVSEWVVSRAPWEDTTQRWVPVHRTAARQIDDAPANLAERFDRIPDGDSRIRIDRFDTATGTRFEVYIAGTQFTHGPSDPWWAGANAELLLSGDSRSVSATEAALREAGVTPTSPVVVTGHSQGGAIAMALANSGRYNIAAIFTVGAPAGLVDSTKPIPIVHVVHPEDIVPALGGEVRTTSGTTWVVHTSHGEVGADAHVADTYRPTVTSIGRLDDPVLSELENALRVDGPGTAMWFSVRTSG